jgi:hypothetical protein
MSRRRGVWPGRPVAMQAKLAGRGFETQYYLAALRAGQLPVCKSPRNIRKWQGQVRFGGLKDDVDPQGSAQVVHEEMIEVDLALRVEEATPACSAHCFLGIQEDTQGSHFHQRPRRHLDHLKFRGMCETRAGEEGALGARSCYAGIVWRI